MRLEQLSFRTWMLGALAIAGLVSAVASGFGWGARVPALPTPEEVATTPVPVWHRASPRPPASTLTAMGEHPLFEPDRQPHPFLVDGEQAPAASQSLDFSLSSVLIAPGLRLAILQPCSSGEAVRVHEGEAVPGAAGWTLAEVTPRTAAFDGPGGRQELELSVFVGTATSASATPSVPRAVSAGNPSGAPPLLPSSAPVARPPLPMPAPAPALTQEQQVEAIRARIEARRRQMQSQAQGAPAPVRPTP